jgi:hypothetical protein
MSDVELFAKLAPKRLTSLGEDFKSWRKEIYEDEKRNTKKGRQAKSRTSRNFL